LLAGTLPVEYASLPKLQSLWVFSNKLKGQLPAAYGAMAELRDLQVSYNRFTGENCMSVNESVAARKAIANSCLPGRLHMAPEYSSKQIHG
jgi:hypothetical protein